MRCVFVGLVVGLLVVTTVSGAELLTNGDFEQDISVGWTEQASGGEYTIGRDIFHNADPDYEACVRKYLTGYATLTQTVSVPNTNLFFSAEARFSNECEDNVYNYFAASAIRLEYQDSSGVTLGETRIFSGTEYCDWASTSSLHLIEVAGDEWLELSFLVEEEVRNIPDVNPDDVAQVTISLYAYSTDYC